MKQKAIINIEIASNEEGQYSVKFNNEIVGKDIGEAVPNNRLIVSQTELQELINYNYGWLVLLQHYVNNKQVVPISLIANVISGILANQLLMTFVEKKETIMIQEDDYSFLDENN